jgi:hypothetical protein
VRKSVAVLAVVALVAAAAVAVVALWLPAYHQRRDTAWAAAGQRALARVTLTSPYRSVPANPHFQACTAGTTQRCFIGPGDPVAQTASVKAALAAVASGSVDVSCHAVQLPGSPSSCHLSAPVAGSGLIAELFAPRDRNKPVAQWTYSGAYVQFHIAHR